MTEKEKPPFIPPKQDSDSGSVTLDKPPPVKIKKKRVGKKSSKTNHKNESQTHFLRTALRANVHKQREESRENLRQMSITEEAIKEEEEEKEEEKKKKRNSKTKLHNRKKSSSSLPPNDLDKENAKEKDTEMDKEITKPRKKSSKLAVKGKTKATEKVVDPPPPLFMRHSAERAEIRKNRLRAASKEEEEEQKEEEQEEEGVNKTQLKKTSATKIRKKSSLFKANGAPNFMRHSALRAEIRKERLAKKEQEENEKAGAPIKTTSELQLLSKMVRKSNEFLRTKSDTDAPRRTKSNSNEEKPPIPIVVKKRKSLVKVRRKSSQHENEDFNINSVDLKRNPKKNKRNSSTEKDELPGAVKKPIKKVKSVVIDDNPSTFHIDEDETTNSYGTNNSGSGSEPESVQKPLVSIMKKTHHNPNHEKHNKQSLEENLKGKKLSTKKKDELKNEKQIKNDTNKKSKKNSTSYKMFCFSFKFF